MREHPVVAMSSLLVEPVLSFDFEQLCQASCCAPDRLRAFVDEGILVPEGDSPAAWVFPAASLQTARTALRLVDDLELNVAGVAMVMGLRTEIAYLRARLYRSGLGPWMP